MAREVEQNGGHFDEHTIALRHLVTRMQRRQFDRYAGRLDDIATSRRRADRGDGAIIGSGVARGVDGGMRGFSEHVIGMPVTFLLSLARPVDRLIDGATHHELAAENVHRRGHRLAHDRFAGPDDKVAQGGAQIVLARIGAQQAAGQHQCPGRGVDKDRLRLPEMAFPISLTDLVADQPVDRLRIGDAQQGFGETQQRHPFPRGQRILMQKSVDAALAEPLAADGGDKAARPFGDAVLQVCRDLGRGEDARRRSGLVDPAAVAQCGARRCCRRRRGSEHHIHAQHTLGQRRLLFSGAVTAARLKGPQRALP